MVGPGCRRRQGMGEKRRSYPRLSQSSGAAASSMLPRLVPMILFVALASCGAGKSSTRQAEGGSAVDKATLANIQPHQRRLRDGQPIPAQYTCDGADQRPALRWSIRRQAEGALRSSIDDPDAPSGTFRHWGVFDIPSSGAVDRRWAKGRNRSEQRFRQAGIWRSMPTQGARTAPLSLQTIRA